MVFKTPLCYHSYLILNLMSYNYRGNNMRSWYRLMFTNYMFTSWHYVIVICLTWSYFFAKHYIFMAHLLVWRSDALWRSNGRDDGRSFGKDKGLVIGLIPCDKPRKMNYLLYSEPWVGVSPLYIRWSMWAWSTWFHICITSYAFHANRFIIDW